MIIKSLSIIGMILIMNSYFSSEKPDNGKSGLHPGGSIMIFKNINASFEKKAIAYMQLGNDKKVISEHISAKSDCRSFGFPVLYHTRLKTPGIDENAYIFHKQDREIDDSICQLLDYSVSTNNNKGELSILLYSIKRETYDQPAKNK